MDDDTKQEGGGAADPNAAPPGKVALFDPASPDAPVMELVGNFDPAKHVRWEHRPGAPSADPARLDAAGPPTLTSSGSGGSSSSPRFRPAAPGVVLATGKPPNSDGEDDAG